MPKLAVDKLPAYRHHKARGLAVVTLNGKNIYLGPYGTSASKAEYDRVISEWIANGRRLLEPRDDLKPDLAITELIAAYWRHAQSYYVKDGRPTSEQGWIKHAMRPLRRLYGSTLASAFGPLALKAVRQAMIDHGDCRATINGYITRIKRMFKWAVENELVRPDVHHGLQAVAGLRRGRSEVREAASVQPVPDVFVDALRPHVSREVWAMIEIQRRAGLRPGEVVLMRASDIDLTGSIWHYRPESHKTEHHGHTRVVELGPRAQQVIRPFLKPELDAFLFSPAEAEAERAAGRRQRRQTPVQPSQRNRRQRNPKRPPRERYTTASYRRAIQRGCDKADREAKKAEGLPSDSERLVPRWHPHQLRHNFATRIRKEHGLEAARVLLGHRSMAVTEVYAELDRSRVAEIVARTG